MFITVHTVRTYQCSDYFSLASSLDQTSNGIQVLHWGFPAGNIHFHFITGPVRRAPTQSEFLRTQWVGVRPFHSLHFSKN